MAYLSDQSRPITSNPGPGVGSGSQGWVGEGQMLKPTTSPGSSHDLLTLGCSFDMMAKKLLARVENSFEILNLAILL